MYRTDRNNNPTAFTTEVASQAGLTEGVDYEVGDRFRVGGKTYYTARLLGDPVKLTERVIDAVGFYTRHKRPRWTYIAMPKFVWDSLPCGLRRRVIGWMYRREGGTALRGLFEDTDPRQMRFDFGEDDGHAD